MSFTICGIAKIEDEYKNIIFNENEVFNDSKLKELIYSTEFGEVEAMIGFRDLDIVEISIDDSIVHNARVFLRDNEFAKGIIFLREGSLIINDLTFFSAYTRKNEQNIPYISLIESNTYEDEEAATLIEEDLRLQ
jgi:hypothetical protein